MVAWARVAAVCAVTLACGGRAQRTEPNEDAASGGASAGSANEATAGRGEASAGAGGTTGNAGAGSTAGAPTPVAGEGGDDAASGANTAGADADVPEAPPSGVPIGAFACPQGTTTEYQAPLPQVGEGFRGELDGTPIELHLGAPSYGALTVAGGCPRARVWTVEFFFDGAFRGDQLTLYFDSSEGCIVQSWYVPEGGDAQSTAVEASLHLWEEAEHGTDMARFVYGTLAVRSQAPDGSVTHELRGEISLYLPTYVCVG